MQASSITRSSVKTSGMRSVIRDLETREKGVDICIMMDGTGSMVGNLVHHLISFQQACMDGVICCFPH